MKDPFCNLELTDVDEEREANRLRALGTHVPVRPSEPV